jgi:hypothetical protein
MREKAIVILGTRTDPHVDRVAKRLDVLGFRDTIIIDYHAGTTYSLEFDRQARRRLIVDGEPVPDACIVWDKTKIIPGSKYYIRGDDESSAGYAAQEWRSYYKLIAAFAGSDSVNNIRSRECMLKPYQQTVAASVGLLVPRTLVSNDKEDIARFQSRCGQMIMKSLSGAKVSTRGEGELAPYIIMTMRVSAADIDSADESEFLYCPHFVQEEIGKHHELRIVVVGDRIIPFRIESQDHQSTRTDWRRAHNLNRFIRCDIPAILEERVSAFMRSMGLATGSLDLIVDNEGRFWFLECNQDGVWAWLDDLVDGEITNAFADELLGRARNAGPRQAAA